MDIDQSAGSMVM